MTGHVYAVASGKGGVGKTTTVVNLGVMLRAEGNSVVLVDADLGMPNLADMLGVDHDPTLHDVLAGDATVEDAINEESEGFGIVQGTHDLTGFAIAEPTGLGDVVEELAERYEYVLLDTGPGLSHEDVLPLGLANEVILVTTPSETSVGDVEKTNELVDIVDGEVAGVVITHADQDTDPEEIGDRLGTTVLGVIPNDPVVRKSNRASQPLEAFDPDSRAAAAYRRLAARLIEANAPNVDALDLDGLESPDSGPMSPPTDSDTEPDESSETRASDEDDIESSEEDNKPTATDETGVQGLDGAIDDSDRHEGQREGQGQEPSGTDSDDSQEHDGDQENTEADRQLEPPSPATDDATSGGVQSQPAMALGESGGNDEDMPAGETDEIAEEDTEGTEAKKDESSQRGGVLGWFSRRLS